jgi:hypothetical protein
MYTAGAGATTTGASGLTVGGVTTQPLSMAPNTAAKAKECSQRRGAWLESVIVIDVLREVPSAQDAFV